jgi:hypothetical protein
MTREGDARETRISNWTLATGMPPAQRQVDAPFGSTLRGPASVRSKRNVSMG